MLKYQNEATSGQYLEKILNDKNVPLEGIVVKSQLKDFMKNPKKGFYILNYGRFFQGTHWAVINVIDKYNFEFFSSFGDPPLQAIKNDSNVDTIYNNLKIQSNYSNNCGMYCVAYILWRNSKRTFKSFIDNFSAVDSERDLLKNDRKVFNIINSF